jgi:hypothetical protein
MAELGKAAARSLKRRSQLELGFIVLSRKALIQAIA